MNDFWQLFTDGQFEFVWLWLPASELCYAFLCWRTVEPPLFSLWKCSYAADKLPLIFFDVLSRLPSLKIFTIISEINFYLPLNGLRLFCVMLVPNIIYHATIFVFITHFFYNFLLTHMLNSIIHKFNFLGILLIFIFDL